MDDDTAAPRSLFALVMFAAGPGTITAVVTLAAVHTPRGLPMTAIVAAVIGAGVTFAVLLLAASMGSLIRDAFRRAGDIRLKVASWPTPASTSAL